MSSSSSSSRPSIIPKKIFIVPYRAREKHLIFFRIYMKYLMEDEVPGSYRVVFSHQTDTHPFNRGAVKNIGFLAMKKEYPNHYKDITFVFNDIDTLPHKKGLLPYDTTHGVIKHFYGFTFALGGIFSIKGGDFEKVNGFPNYWGWGMEDNVIYQRALHMGLKVDRSVFFSLKTNNMNILQFESGLQRLISRSNSYKSKQDVSDPQTKSGLNTIKPNRLSYGPRVDQYENFFIDIRQFETELDPSEENFEQQNLMLKGGRLRVHHPIKERFRNMQLLNDPHRGKVNRNNINKSSNKANHTIVKRGKNRTKNYGMNFLR